MKRLLFLLFCCLPLAQAAEQPMAELGGEFWFTPRHGDALTGREDLAAAVKRLLEEPEAYLVLRYPETESGELWGQELQAWLVSLGVVSDRIELEPDTERLETVGVVLVDPTVVEETPPLQIESQVPDGEADAAAAGQAEPGATNEQQALETADEVVTEGVATQSEATAPAPEQQPEEQAVEEQVETE